MGKRNRWALKPESEWIHIPVEPIVAPDVWERCYAMLVERRTTKKYPGRKPQHLFTGYLHCRCGHRMYVPWRSSRYTCYGCRTTIRDADLEAIFREQLRAFLVSPEEIARHLGKADEEIHAREERLVALEVEAGKVQAELDRLYRLYASDNITPDGYGRTARPLEERRQALEDEIPRLRGEIDFRKIQYLSKDEILAEGRDLYERWTTLTREEQRAIVEALVRTITVGKQEVEVDLAYFPDSPEIAAERPRDLPAARRRRVGSNSDPRSWTRLKLRGP